MGSDGLTAPVDFTNSVGNDGAPSWSPDGTKIAFASDRTGEFEIFVANALECVRKAIALDPNDEYNQIFAATTLAFARYSEDPDFLQLTALADTDAASYHRRKMRP